MELIDRKQAVQKIQEIYNLMCQMVNTIHDEQYKSDLLDYCFKYHQDCLYYLQNMTPIYSGEIEKGLVPVEVLQQVMWERDAAIEQIEELGGSFGEITKQRDIQQR